MVIAGIPREEIRHTRAVQDWLAEDRQEGRQEGEAAVTLRLLIRRCGPLSDATTAQIQALPLEQLEALAVGEAFSAGVALLDFQGPADLAAWLAANASFPPLICKCAGVSTGCTDSGRRPNCHGGRRPSPNEPLNFLPPARRHCLLMMAATYTAVISQDGPWWMGWVEEVPGVNAQEHSRDELLASLRQAAGPGLRPVKRRDQAVPAP